MPAINLKDVNMTTYKFMTLNFWCKNRDLTRRIERMGNLVKKHNPDIIALQEITFRHLAFLKLEPWFRMYECYGTKDDLVNNLYHFEIILSRVPLRNVRRIPFTCIEKTRRCKRKSSSSCSSSEEEEEEISDILGSLKLEGGDDGEEKKDAKDVEPSTTSFLVAEMWSGPKSPVAFFDGPDYVSTYPIFSVATAHLESFSSGKEARKLQLGQMFEQFSHDDSIPVIMMGDFNMVGQEDSDIIPDGWKDVWIATGQSLENGFTFDHTRNFYIRGTWQSRLDRIYIKNFNNSVHHDDVADNNQTSDEQCSNIYIEQVAVEQPISDHFGLLMTWKVNNGLKLQ